MFYLFSQMFLAARNNDIGEWGNILFVVILAIFWVVGGIIKAVSQKRQQQEQQQSQPKSFFKSIAEEMQAGPRPKPTQRISQKTKPSVQKRSLPKQPARPAGPRVREVPAQKPNAEKVETKAAGGVEELERSPIFESEKKLTGKLTVIDIERTDIERDILKQRAARKTAKGQEPIRDLLDLEDSDELKRAILHYEILGKPISLRKPSGKYI
ncbi:hypothetical protein ACFL1G_03480 [Planctomycetota bacterium]